MNPPDPDLYLVRIWRSPGAFRATVRRVDEDELHCLHSAQELAEFLATPRSPAAAVCASTDRPAARAD
jgi:hypothetical protein